MKIAVVLSYTEESGGGYIQAVSAIRQLSRIAAPGGHTVIAAVTSVAAGNRLRQMGLEVLQFKRGISDRWCAWAGESSVGRGLQGYLRIVGKLERTLMDAGVDLVYFATPSNLALGLQKLNFIFTVWDLCHLDSPEFPEVREFGEFQRRQRLYGNGVPRAVLTLADCEETRHKLASRYGADPGRILAMPFSPSEFLGAPDARPKDEVLAKYGLTGGYLFYPAQFWPHKNHHRLLQALLELRERRLTPQLLLSGSDQGALESLKRFIEANGLSQQVVLPGFVPREDMQGLYQGAHAVVMPGYFGPTNIPPLDAWATGKPLVYSSVGAVQAGDAAILIDPDDQRSLADAIEKVLDPVVAADLAARGTKRLSEISREREQAEAVLAEKLERFAAKPINGVAHAFLRRAP